MNIHVMSIVGQALHWCGGVCKSVSHKQPSKKPAERCTAPECPAGQQARSESNALSGVSQSPLTFGNARSIIPCTPHSQRYAGQLMSLDG